MLIVYSPRPIEPLKENGFLNIKKPLVRWLKYMNKLAIINPLTLLFPRLS